MRSRRGVDAREHASEERAVSKVVAVVLMTAIVIALAATVATTLTGFAELLNDLAPQAVFSFEYYDDVKDPSAYHPEIESETSEIVVVEHISGDRIDPDQLEFEVTMYNNAESQLQSIRVPWSDATGGNVISVSLATRRIRERSTTQPSKTVGA